MDIRTPPGVDGLEEMSRPVSTRHAEVRAPRLEMTPLMKHAGLDTLPLHSRTPVEWGREVLADPVALLIDHAFLERKAANNAMELLTKWPGDGVPGWVETMTAVARDETAHLAQVVRLLKRRGGELDRVHKNPYAGGLRQLVRKGTAGEIVDRLMVAALIEARSCERFAVLAEAATNPAPGQAADLELAAFYRALFTSELGHYQVFLKLAYKIAPRETVDSRWKAMLTAEAEVLADQEPGFRIHSGCRDSGGWAESQCGA